MDQYEKGPLIGVGIHGRVYRGTHKPTQRTVALKKVCVGDVGQGVALAAVREIAVVRELKAPCFVSLLDAFPHKKTLVLVFEYMAVDLDVLIKDRARPLLPANIKTYMRTLLQALSLMHAQGIIHRDIKPNNILVSASGEPKLADFGLARIINSPVARLTKEIGGRCYRAPELMFGADQYTCMVDIWAAGCVLAEMLLRKVWFPGNSDMNQLEQIFRVLGSPCASTWPAMLDLPNFIPWKPIEAPPLASQFPASTDPLALDLLHRLVQLNPAHRLSADAALQHPYFFSPPLPSGPEDMCPPCSTEPQQPSSHSVLSRIRAMQGGAPLPLGEAHLPSYASLQPAAPTSLPRSDSLPQHAAQDATTSATPADEQLQGSFRFRIGQIPHRFSFSNLNSCDSHDSGSGGGAAAAAAASSRRPVFGWRPSPLGASGAVASHPSSTTSEDPVDDGGRAAAAAAAAAPGGPAARRHHPGPRCGFQLPPGLLSCSTSATPVAEACTDGLAGEPTPTGPTASLPFTFAPTLASGRATAAAAAAAASSEPTPAWPPTSLSAAFPPDAMAAASRPTPAAMSTGATSGAAPCAGAGSSAAMLTASATAPFSDLPSKRRRLFESEVRPTAPPAGGHMRQWETATPVDNGAPVAPLFSALLGRTPEAARTPELLCMEEEVPYSAAASAAAVGVVAAAAAGGEQTMAAAMELGAALGPSASAPPPQFPDGGAGRRGLSTFEIAGGATTSLSECDYPGNGGRRGDSPSEAHLRAREQAARGVDGLLAWPLPSRTNLLDKCGDSAGPGAAVKTEARALAHALFVGAGSAAPKPQLPGGASASGLGPAAGPEIGDAVAGLVCPAIPPAAQRDCGGGGAAAAAAGCELLGHAPPPAPDPAPNPAPLLGSAFPRRRLNMDQAIAPSDSDPL